MKKLLLLIFLFSFSICLHAQFDSDFLKASKDLDIAFNEAKTGFVNIRGRIKKNRQYNVKPNIFTSNDNYVEFPTKTEDYAIYSQNLPTASSKKEGKKIINFLITEAKKVIPQNYVLTKGDINDLDEKMARGYYGVYAPDKGQELLYILHHPSDKGFGNNKYPSVAFTLNFRNGKRPRIDMVVFSAIIETLENANFAKAEVAVNDFNYDSLDDLEIDWERKEFHFGKSTNKWDNDYFIVPFEGGVYLDYSSFSEERIGIKSMAKSNIIVNDDEKKNMDFFWIEFNYRRSKNDGLKALKEILKHINIPYSEQKYDLEKTLLGYDFNIAIGEYEGYVLDTNTSTADKSQQIKIYIDTDLNITCSKKVGDDWIEFLNSKLFPYSVIPAESDGEDQYIYTLDENENVKKKFSLTINNDASRSKYGGAATFIVNNSTIEQLKFYIMDRKVKNFTYYEDKAQKIILTGEAYENDPWGDYKIVYSPNTNNSQITYKNVTNTFNIRKVGYEYTVDLFKSNKTFDAKFNFINGKILLDKIKSKNFEASKEQNAYNEIEALHAIAKIYSKNIIKTTKHTANFTIDHENRDNGVGILLNDVDCVYVGSFINNNVPNGKGNLYWINGSIEKGSFIDAKRDGWFDIEDSKISYSGMYKNNYKEGKFVYKSKNTGRTKTVIYKNNEIIEETEWQ